MNSVFRFFFMIFVVAVLCMSCEAQRRSNNIGSGRYRGGGRGGSRNQDGGYGFPGGFRGARNQANQGGSQPQRGSQSASNTNFGSGTINNNQDNGQSQSGRQANANGSN